MPSSSRSVGARFQHALAGDTEVDRVRLEHGLEYQRQGGYAGIEIHRRRAGSQIGVVDEFLAVAPRSRGVNHLADGLPEIVLRGGEQVEQGRRVVLRAQELLDNGLRVPPQDLEVGVQIAGDRQSSRAIGAIYCKRRI